LKPKLYLCGTSYDRFVGILATLLRRYADYEILVDDYPDSAVAYIAELSHPQVLRVPPSRMVDEFAQVAERLETLRPEFVIDVRPVGKGSHHWHITAMETETAKRGIGLMKIAY